MVSVSFYKHVLRLCCGASLILATGIASAQAVMNERSLTEENVKEKLLPNEAGEPEVTRGIAIAPNAAAPSVTSVAHSTSSGVASMLFSFLSNSSQLTPAAKEGLNEVAKAMRSTELAAYRFKIEGHADPLGSFAANMRLSEQRAQAVVRYLSNEGGVAPERLTAVGKGSLEPLNTHNLSAPENRRVTIITQQ